MPAKKFLPSIAWAAANLLIAAVECRAQEPAMDHSCTLQAGGEFAIPYGKDGKNFKDGGGFQVGGGFSVTPAVEPRHGVVLFLTTNFMYSKLHAVHPPSGDSAHGSFYATTFDFNVRYPISHRTNLYLLGGFGWLRRGVSVNGPDQATLLLASSPTVEKVGQNSGVFDAGGGVNFGLTHKGGLMLFAEVRIYKGLAINSGTTLLPVSAGVRW